jgi:hypothetical protein
MFLAKDAAVQIGSLKRIQCFKKVSCKGCNVADRFLAKDAAMHERFLAKVAALRFLEKNSVLQIGSLQRMQHYR